MKGRLEMTSHLTLIRILTIILFMIYIVLQVLSVSLRLPKTTEAASINGGSSESPQLCHTPNLSIMGPDGVSTFISSAWCQPLNDLTCLCSLVTTSTER